MSTNESSESRRKSTEHSARAVEGIEHQSAQDVRRRAARGTRRKHPQQGRPLAASGTASQRPLSKSLPGRNAFAPRSGRDSAKFPSASLSSPTRKPRKRNSSRTFRGPTCIRSRKRKGFALLLDREGAGSTPLRSIAAKTGKAAAFIAKRLRLLDLTQPCGRCVHGGTYRHRTRPAHRQARTGSARRGSCSIASMAITARTISERSLVPVSRLQAWIDAERLSQSQVRSVLERR